MGPVSRPVRVAAVVVVAILALYVAATVRASRSGFTRACEEAGGRVIDRQCWVDGIMEETQAEWEARQ